MMHALSSFVISFEQSQALLFDLDTAQNILPASPPQMTRIPRIIIKIAPPLIANPPYRLSKSVESVVFLFHFITVKMIAMTMANNATIQPVDMMNASEYPS